MVIFDIVNFPYYGLKDQSIALIIVFIGLVWICLRKYLRLRFLVFYSRHFEYSILLFISLWASITSFSFLNQYYKINKVYSDGKAIVVTGYITNFEPMPSDGHGYEKFKVNGYVFEYSENIITPWFNSVNIDNNIIKSGICVRIAFVPIQKSNAITKFEILKSGCNVDEMDN